LLEKAKENINGDDNTTASTNAPVSLGAKTMSSSLTTKTPDQDEIEAAVEKTIYQFLGVLVIAVAIGTAFGVCCIMCISKSCARSQTKRLSQAKSNNKLQFVSDTTVGNSVTMKAAG